jgi:hypothetical protein
LALSNALDGWNFAAHIPNSNRDRSVVWRISEITTNTP